METRNRTYERFAQTLSELLANEQCVRIRTGSYMPLSIERIGESGDEHRLVAISHTAIQNGDLMRDPEMVFEFVAPGVAEPISFRNDFMGLYQEVYDYDDQGKRAATRPSLKKELRAFARTWFANLKHQGFLNTEADREALS